MTSLLWLEWGGTVLDDVVKMFDSIWFLFFQDFYGELEESGDFEIVFVSFDRSASDLSTYMNESHGDWYFIQHGDAKIQYAHPLIIMSIISCIGILYVPGRSPFHFMNNYIHVQSIGEVWW